MEGTSDLEVVGGNGIVGSCDVVEEVCFSDITKEILPSLCFSVSKCIGDIGRWGQDVNLPWAPKIAARIGLAWSKVRVERAMNA